MPDSRQKKATGKHDVSQKEKKKKKIRDISRRSSELNKRIKVKKIWKKRGYTKEKEKKNREIYTHIHRF